jgi:hypothetical protein
LAAVGQRLIDTVSKSIISQAFETLDGVLEEKTSAAEEDREASLEKASESDYLSAVARGLLAAPWMRWVLAILAVGIIIALALLLLG